MDPDRERKARRVVMELIGYDPTGCEMDEVMLDVLAAIARREKERGERFAEFLKRDQLPINVRPVAEMLGAEVIRVQAVTPAGTAMSANLDRDIEAARRAITDGDVIAMLRVCELLKCYR